MRAHLTLVVTALVGFAAWAAGAGAQAAVLLELPASARAVGVGNAGAALSGDDASLFYNPAQLATIGRSAASLSLQRWIAGSTLGAVSAAARLGPGFVALGVLALDYGSEDEYVPDPGAGGEIGTPTGRTVSAGDAVIAAGYAMTMRGVRAGVAGKLVQQRVANESGSAVATDLGVAGEIGRVTLSAALQHLGTSLELAGDRAPLPRTIRAGAAATAYARGPVAVRAIVELSQVRGRGTAVGGGAEIGYQWPGRVRLAARAGALPRHERRMDGSALTFGAGLAARRLALDYAYRSLDVLGGATHRLGVRWWR